jgi:hypothetical protein
LERVVNVFPDNPFEAMAQSMLGRSLLEQFRECDRVFVHDRFALGQLRQLRVRSDFIAFARDPDYHSPVSESRKGEGAGVRIAFVGNPDPERIRYLSAIADLGVGLWGRWDWARLPESNPLASCIMGTEVVGPDMARVLSSADISVNILRASQKTAHNMRTFDSPACGACTVSETSNGVLELMRVGREVVTFASKNELRDACIGLLADSTRRKEIGAAGFTRVKDDTYLVRARQILAAVT